MEMTEKELKVKNNRPPSDKYVKYVYNKTTKLTEVEFKEARPVTEEDRKNGPGK